MKKLLILSIAIVTLFSCSSEDTTDPIIGTWTLSSYSDVDEELSDCEKRTTITFKENNTLSSTPYVFYNDECIVDGASTGTWTNKGNTIYSVKMEEEDEGEDAKVFFSNNNNTMNVIFSEEGDDQEYTTTYIREN